MSVTLAVIFECIPCRAVECKTVALDDRHLFSPKKVNSIRTDLGLELERRESRDEAEAEHLRFQHAFGLLRVKAPLIQHVPDPGDAGSTLTSDLEQGTPCRPHCQVAGDQIVLKRAVQKVRGPCRHIEECPRRSRRRNSIVILVVNERKLNRTMEDKFVSMCVFQSVPRQNVNFAGFGKRGAMKPSCGWSRNERISSARKVSCLDALMWRRGRRGEARHVRVLEANDTGPDRTCP